MIKILDFCILKFYDNYVISTINEDVDLTIEKSNLMAKIAGDYFGKKPFVYITNRINNYTVDPEVYKRISKLECLAGFVVVSNSIGSIKNALFEKIFLDKPFQIFNNLDDAILWAENILPIKEQIKSSKKSKKV